MTKPASIFPLVEEVPLPRAPLVAVLAQVRFESILSIQDQAKLAPFQDAVRSHYPVLRPEQNQSITFNPQGGVIVNHTQGWRFSDLEEKWKISLSTDSISIETTQYKSRIEFLKEFEHVLSALATHFSPGVVTRTGLRYVNRLTGDALAQLPELVKPAFLGVLSSDLGDIVEMAISETLFQIAPFQLFSRWGRIPAHSTTDPVMIRPMDKPSWILDIDCSNNNRKVWNQSELLNEFKDLAETNYNFFRWAVADEFLNHFGGKK